MADIRDADRFMKGRWAWTSCGYEQGFPRNSQFGDLDAIVEFDGRGLAIESKHHDGTVGSPMDYPSTGQMRLLRTLVRLGIAVIVLYGMASLNEPYGVRVIGFERALDRWENWRGKDQAERRRLLKYEIDLALGLVDPQPTLYEQSIQVPRVGTPEPWTPGDVTYRRPADWQPEGGGDVA